MGVAFIENGRGPKNVPSPPYFLRAGAGSGNFYPKESYGISVLEYNLNLKEGFLHVINKQWLGKPHPN